MCLQTSPNTVVYDIDRNRLWSIPRAHWSFFNKVLLWFYSKVCHCDFTKYSLWNLELPPHVPSSQLETTLKQPCLLWGMSVSDFESLVWVLQHKELCLCGPLAQGLRGVVFLQVWSKGHQDQSLWGWGPRICISTCALSDFCVCWSREISFIIWRKGGFQREEKNHYSPTCSCISVN